MNKKELIIALSKNSSIDKKTAEKVIDSLVVTVKDALKKNEEVNITGLGTFMLIKRAGYTGRNPKTQEKLEIPEVIIPYFKSSKILKESIK